MAINLEVIGDDPVKGKEIIDTPLNNNFLALKSVAEGNTSTIQSNTSALTNKVDVGTIYTIGNINTSDINNDTAGLSGIKLDGALAGLNNRISGHDNSDGITNVSNTNGITISDTLDYLDDSITAISAGDLNVLVGVYTGFDNVNINDYTFSKTGLSLFSGLRVDLFTNYANLTQVATLDIQDGNGINNIVTIKPDGTKSNTLPKQIYGWNPLKYDGADWVLLTSFNPTNIGTATTGQVLVNNGDGTMTFVDGYDGSDKADQSSLDITDGNVSDNTISISDNLTAIGNTVTDIGNLQTDKVNTSDYSNTDVLNKVKAVDGYTSGLVAEDSKQVSGYEVTKDGAGGSGIINFITT